MDQLYGYGLYAISLLTVGGLYAIMTLGLNVQWGFGGLFNAGIAGFFAVGAYVSALLTKAEAPEHLGGYELPIPLGVAAAMLVAAAIAWGIGKVCIRLRSDYLAIATIGIAEILRLVLKNESWATNGPRGISGIPQAFGDLPEPWGKVAFMLLVLATVFAIYLVLERAWRSPWGRVMTAIRDSEDAARAAGKDIEAFRLQAFVLGAALMALGGAYFAQYTRYFGPDSSDPSSVTFLVWVMLIMGGSANNRGAILGAMLLWAIWSGTQIVTGWLPREIVIFGNEINDVPVRAAYLRIFLIGLVLQIVLQRYSAGILPETRPAAAGTARPAGP
ncbi:MAG: branched-chain amino acid ABC transporter permease [Pseudomonadota bacterium]